MTIDQFLVELTDCAAQFTWRITNDHMIRGYPCRGPITAARALCPITALACAKYGLVVVGGKWLVAAKILEIERGDRTRIVEAVDNSFKRLSAPGMRLRTLHLEAVGLRQKEVRS